MNKIPQNLGKITPKNFNDFFPDYSTFKKYVVDDLKKEMSTNGNDWPKWLVEKIDNLVITKWYSQEYIYFILKNQYGKRISLFEQEEFLGYFKNIYITYTPMFFVRLSQIIEDKLSDLIDVKNRGLRSNLKSDSKRSISTSPYGNTATDFTSADSMERSIYELDNTNLNLIENARMLASADIYGEVEKYVNVFFELFTQVDIITPAVHKYGLENIKGDKGDQGPKGDQGVKGDQGIQGPKGDQGVKGDQGIQGPKGDQGVKGDQGIQGPKGDTGPQGPKGDKGDTGPQGPKGDKGDPGSAANAIPKTITPIPGEQLVLGYGVDGNSNTITMSAFKTALGLPTRKDITATYATRVWNANDAGKKVWITVSGVGIKVGFISEGFDTKFSDGGAVVDLGINFTDSDSHTRFYWSTEHVSNVGAIDLFTTPKININETDYIINKFEIEE